MTILYKIICVYIYIDIILYIYIYGFGMIWFWVVVSYTLICQTWGMLGKPSHIDTQNHFLHLLSLESSDPNLKETTWRTISASESYRSSSYVISIANALLENSNQTWGAACTACTNPKGAPAIWLTNTHYSSVSCSTTSQLTGMGGSTTTRIDSDY